MEHQPRKSRRTVNHEYSKPYREKRKDRLHKDRRTEKTGQEQKHILTAKEISEETLKQMHTIGTQKFGSYPFSVHFDRWLMNAKIILSEFESNPNISIDEEFLAERTHILSDIEKQFEQRRRSEALLDQQAKNLADCKNTLEKLKTEYFTTAKEIETRRNRELKRLNRSIEDLKSSR